MEIKTNPVSNHKCPETPCSLPTTDTATPLAYQLMADIKPEPVRWLWRGRIPLGEITLIEGDPGTNKSSLVLDIAARLSTGRPMPNEENGEQGSVLLLAGEDSVTKTLPFRLQAAGANLQRIAVMNRVVVIPDDLDYIEETVVKISGRLLVIDPLSTFLGRSTNNEQAVRQALTPLGQFADRTNTAVIMIRHLSKSGSRRALYKGLGSIGCLAARRSAFLVAKDPQDEHMRVLCHNKCNLGPLAPSLLFEPLTTKQSLRIEWRGECDYTADDLLVPSVKTQSKLDEAKQFLLELLADGPVGQAAVERQAGNIAIAYRTVERAKNLLGIEARRVGFGPGSSVQWELPISKDSAP